MPYAIVLTLLLLGLAQTQAAAAASAQLTLPFDWARAEATAQPLGEGVARIAYVHPVDIDSRRDGQWTQAGGQHVWTLLLKVEGAAQLAAVFDYQTVPGAALAVAGQTLRRSQRQFMSRPVAGDTLGLVMTAPDSGGRPQLKLTELSLSSPEQRRIIFGEDDSPQAQAPAQSKTLTQPKVDGEFVRYECYQTDWNTNPARASVKLFTSAGGQCSATFINNNAGGVNRPLLLTAEHCQPKAYALNEASPPDAELAGNRITLIWKQQYHCNGEFILPTYQYGARHVTEAVGSGGDQWLIELEHWPVASAEAYQAGYDARPREQQPLDFFYMMHFCGNWAEKQYFQSTHWYELQDGYEFKPTTSGDLGDSCPGSSGAGLFNIDNRLIGTLSSGGTDSISVGGLYTDFGEYISWTRLGPYLSADPSAQRTLDGAEPQILQDPIISVALSPQQAGAGDSITVTWDAQNVEEDSCYADAYYTDGNKPTTTWSGPRPFSGSESLTLPKRSGSLVISLNCTWAGADAVGKATIKIPESGGALDRWLLMAMLGMGLWRRARGAGLVAEPRIGDADQVVTPAKAGVQILDSTGFRLSPE